MRYGSLDVGHVPPPNPEYFWPFSEGQARSIAVYGSKVLSFRVNVIRDGWIHGTQFYGPDIIDGELHLDFPVVIVRTPEGAPSCTLTLRKIEDGKAYLQVTMEPGGTKMTRQ